jgi:hypothetical protein
MVMTNPPTSGHVASLVLNKKIVPEADI